MWQENLKDLLKTRKVQVLLSGVLGSATSAAVTYFLVAKRLEKKYEKITAEEISSVKERYSVIYKHNDKGDLDALAAKYQDVVLTNNYTSEEPATVDDIAAELERRDAEEDFVVTNIFESEDPETYFNLEEEMQKRDDDPEVPYVLTRDEFNACEREFEQITLTYFDGDDVLVDAQDQNVPDIDGTVGTINMLRFGHASQDKNVVYIRNERLQVDFEVMKSDGKYAEEVLGYIEHSHKPRPRRFRDYDN